MNTFRSFSLMAASGAVALLAGCAGYGHHMGGQYTGSHPMRGPMGGMGPASAHDMQAMCDMHKKMMAGKSEAERRAIIEEHMQRMSPGMRQHMHAMQEQCR
jgi:hypothetical protein